MATKTQTWESRSVTCEKGHTREITVEQREETGGILGWFFGNDHTKIHPIYQKESYAYTHGGCCYRAAVDAAWEIAAKMNLAWEAPEE